MPEPHKSTKSPALPLIVAIAAAVAVMITLVGLPGGNDEGADDTSASTASARESSQAAPSDDPLAQLARRQADAPMAKGDVDAPVVLIAYPEFQCPFCGKFARDTAPTLVEQYSAQQRSRGGATGVANSRATRTSRSARASRGAARSPAPMRSDLPAPDLRSPTGSRCWHPALPRSGRTQHDRSGWVPQVDLCQGFTAIGPVEQVVLPALGGHLRSHRRWRDVRSRVGLHSGRDVPTRSGARVRAPSGAPSGRW